MRFIVMLMLVVAAATAQTFLWKVTHAGRTLYLGGTVHKLRPADYPLPGTFDKAFAQADTLVLETDLEAMTSLQTVLDFQMRFMYPPGQSLRTSLGRRAYGALERYLRAEHCSTDMFDMMRPSMVLMMLTMQKLTQLGYTADGVDHHFYQKARSRRMPVKWFESIDVQAEALLALGKGHEDAMILSNLAMFDELQSMMRTLIRAWRVGDTVRLQRLGRKYMMTEDAADYRRLVVDRNNAWMAPLEAHIKSPGTELVLVGALHLVGHDGLVAQLRRRGYRVVQQ